MLSTNDHWSTTTTTASVQFIHFQLQLTTVFLGITLVVSKLIPWFQTMASASQQSERWPWRPRVSNPTPTMADIYGSEIARINEYVSSYLSILHFLLLPQVQLQSNVYLFRSSIVLYHQQQHQHVLYQHLCHHDVLHHSSNFNRNTVCYCYLTRMCGQCREEKNVWAMQGRTTRCWQWSWLGPVLGVAKKGSKLKI